MSTKKDKFSLKDKTFMKLALNLAKARIGLTGANPSVGCVIVKNEKIVSIGQTGYGGRPHAEYNAIKNSFQSLKNSKMYVTLEPCNHYGETPPCTNKIIKSGINEVFFSMDDIDKRVKGKTIKILRKNDILVRRGLLKDEVRKLYDSYIINRKNKMPYVSGKIAVSKNKLIYSKSQKRITDSVSDKLTHYLRYKNDAILISNKTLKTDNPRLDCRLIGYENFSPRRIILDRELILDLGCNIIKTAKKGNTIIFHNSKNNYKINFLKRKGVIFIKSKLDRNKLFDLRFILKKLFSLNIRNLLLEGGDKLTKNFLKSNLINTFYLFKSPKIIKDKESLSFTSFDLLDKKYIKKYIVKSKLLKDKITIYKR